MPADPALTDGASLPVASGGSCWESAGPEWLLSLALSGVFVAVVAGGLWWLLLTTRGRPLEPVPAGEPAPSRWPAAVPLVALAVVGANVVTRSPPAQALVVAGLALALLAPALALAWLARQQARREGAWHARVPYGLGVYLPLLTLAGTLATVAAAVVSVRSGHPC